MQHMLSFPKTWRRGGTVTDGLCEIFRPILSKMSGRVFNGALFAKKVEEAYDIRTTNVAAEGIGNRLEELGLLVRDSKNELRVGTVTNDVPQELIDQVEHILENFLDYSRFLLEGNPGENTFEDDELIDALSNFLLSTGPEALLERTEKNYYKGTKVSIKKSNDRPSRKEQELDSIVSMYLGDLSDNSPEKIDFLSAVSSVSVLSDVVLTLQEPVNKEDMKGIDIYIDTPIVFAILDLSTPEDLDYATEFFSLLKSCGVNLKLPEHLLVEFRSGLSTQIEAATSGSQMAYGPLVPRIRSDMATKLRARNIYNSPDKYLAELGVSIISEAEFLNVRYEQYISLVEKTTMELVGVMGPWETSVHRRENDARSIALSFFSRSTKGAESLLECGHVFVTRNETIARNGRETLVNRRQIERREFPPIITDKELAGILWFAGSEVIGRLQKKKLLANCAAIMNPNQAVITTMKEALHNIDPELSEEMEAVVLDRNARFKLSKITRGNENNLENKDMLVVYEELKETLIDEQRLESENEIDELHEIYKEEIGELKKEKEDGRIDFENAILAVVDSSNSELESERQQRIEVEKREELKLEEDKYQLSQEKKLRIETEKQLDRVNKRVNRQAKNGRKRLKWEIVTLLLILFFVISNYFISLFNGSSVDYIAKLVIYSFEFIFIYWLSSKLFFTNLLDKYEKKYIEKERRKLDIDVIG